MKRIALAFFITLAVISTVNLVFAGSPERDPAPHAEYAAFFYIINFCKPGAGSSARDPAETKK